MRFSAVLLAGGKSSRMGRDKVFLECDGQFLWQRQLEKLRRLQPEQLILSGPRKEEWSQCEVVCDEIENAGPLAGIAAALQKSTTPLLVVLAVDLPQMTSAFLESLLADCSPGRGVVPRSGHGFESLAAVYPANCLQLARVTLQGADFSMQNFVRTAMDKNFLIERKISPMEASLFVNLNTPADL